MKRIFFSLSVLVSWIDTYSQSQLAGKIYTTKNTPISDAVVVLIDSLNNTTAYNIVYSDSIGRFSVIAPDMRANQLFVSCLGYKETICSFSPNTSHLRIILEKVSSIKLDEVIVKGVRQRAKVENDRLVYNMDTNPFRDDNALEAFKYVPFIASDGQRFSIIGKSETKIYVNGREKKLSPDAVSNYLKGFPADQIKSLRSSTRPTVHFEEKETSALSTFN